MPHDGRPSWGIFFAIESTKRFFVATIYPLIFFVNRRYNAIDVRSGSNVDVIVPPSSSRPDDNDYNDAGNWTTSNTARRPAPCSDCRRHFIFTEA